jgi:hypothetical protein
MLKEIKKRGYSLGDYNPKYTVQVLLELAESCMLVYGDNCEK